MGRSRRARSSRAVEASRASLVRGSKAGGCARIAWGAAGARGDICSRRDWLEGANGARNGGLGSAGAVEANRADVASDPVRGLCDGRSTSAVVARGAIQRVNGGHSGRGAVLPRGARRASGFVHEAEGVAVASSGAWVFSGGSCPIQAVVAGGALSWACVVANARHRGARRAWASGVAVRSGWAGRAFCSSDARDEGA